MMERKVEALASTRKLLQKPSLFKIRSNYMKENRFDRFKFQPFIIEAIKDYGFNEPTEIQERMIPLVLKNESAIGQSQTGTGKLSPLSCQY